MFILQQPFCCSVISPFLLPKLVTQKKESWCVEEEKIFFSLKLWNISAEQYLNVNTNVFWCIEKKVLLLEITAAIAFHSQVDYVIQK